MVYSYCYPDDSTNSTRLNDPPRISLSRRFANPFVAAERGFIDDVIMPHNTRYRVARALNMLRNKQAEMPWKKHDNIPL
jgi:propionyl-CoA carboxylase beta chain